MIFKIICFFIGHDWDFNISKDYKMWFRNGEGLPDEEYTMYYCKRCKRMRKP